MPDQTTDPGQATLPGIRDYQATIPVSRGTGAGDTVRAELRFRMPATTPNDAKLVGQYVARLLDRRSNPGDGGDAWHTDQTAITVIDVDDTPPIEQIAEELTHVKRVLAALAAKFPMMLQVTPDEYAAADPDAVVAIPFGETRVFMVPPLGTPDLGEEPLLLPADTSRTDETQPEPDGGHRDPDVRDVRAGRLHELPYDKVELQNAHYWMPVEKLENTTDGKIVITCSGRNWPNGDDPARFTIYDPYQRLTVRPVTVAGEGADLPALALRRRQILTEDGWWTLLEGSHLGPAANAVKVLIRQDRTGEIREITVADTHPVLLRDDPAGWGPR